MDKNKIKAFAIWARRNLIGTVTDRARYIGIFIDDNGEFKDLEAEQVQGGFRLKGKEEIFPLSKSDRDKLISEIKEKGFDEIMEEVAYTWFNRFMALRYMEVNEYLPSGIRVLSSEVEGKTEPDVLTRVTDVIDELKLNAEYIYELLDSGKTEDREEAYKHILVKQCNELGKIMPQMFEKISDYTELLLPDNLLEEGSVIRKIVEDIEEEDWKEEVEIIGWMYQYYISEKKDEVFAALKKNVKITKENIPAATQLFTPKWIVKYMVENSLGRLWLEGHPNEELQKEWKYYLEEAQQEPEVEEELKKIREEHGKLTPEDIKILDPCMGSGHILVYAFDVLYEIYKTAGYSEREIPRMILQNNLYGLDIDDRAAQLASFALVMKARHYNRRLFREIERQHLELNICSIQESSGITNDAIDYFAAENEKLKSDVEYLVEVFTDAKEYGSILEVKKIDFDGIKTRLIEILDLNDNIAIDNNGVPVQIDTFSYQYKNIILEKLPMIIKQAEIMSRKYDACITNPPYMGRQNLNKNLIEYFNKYFKNTKTDLFSVFIECCLNKTKKYGHLGFMTPFVWMFLSSYKALREMVVKDKSISSLIQLEYSSFEDATVPICTFTLRNYQSLISGVYVKLSDFKGSEMQPLKVLDAVKNEVEYKYYCKTIDFKILEGYPIAYWLTDTIRNIFKESLKLGEIAEPRVGMNTSDNDRFLRLWHEISNIKIGFRCKSINEAKISNSKWFPYNKGGEARKWYGNNFYVVNWENDGKELREWCEWLNKNRTPMGRLANKEYYFKRGITWSNISSKTFSSRYTNYGHIFDIKGSSMFFNSDNELYIILGFLNCKLTNKFFEILNPTVSFQAGDMKRLPLIMPNNRINHKIIDKVSNNIVLSKYDWDSFEISWDFKIHPILKFLYKEEQHKIEPVFNAWETKCEENFNQLKCNEEELNKIFIDIYGLQDELTPEVEDKDITIRKADRERDIKSFISYAVGCMLGRYSIDVEGNVISDSWVDATFIPDADNVIPITEDEYFEGDIVSRFIEFVRNVYGEETLEENLDFIADSIGRKASETARQAIRRYFIKDFYKDHLKVYQKRPIYWMFESGKNDGFKALVYMHRYNEQTVAKVRTDYLHTLQRKYEAERERQQLIVDSEEYTAKDRTAAKKKISKIAKQIEECREYDQVVAHLANEKISIDLDDGVKVNYAKFQGVKIINSKDKEVKMNLLAKI
ncbi:restriction endonuclease [Clostridium sporogenes]|uniref:BREX-1 system adenine-specific DNA-methyltransferase PglX n=1 Tax=Clostridium botulinum TaxID=1491 RepID=UPI000717A901|nr:BREX-1 system adenine-specific DNA-methyltransferase PglX [Clostridium botulinum]KRU27602.1 restriction endonuclease [Clostridium sporogenes]KRU30961.1 restriction endonuclease [Clostridium sporogenes]KRU31188.1 restriction endonuclease [Clostridium sporogenes]KRU37917.1 restriction endonuclease [Clostridium sporogenes]MBZ1330501.1 BREX-1 system adenine-specific DNA-methyltransferase PglX [Clostridium botulinum]